MTSAGAFPFPANKTTCLLQSFGFGPVALLAFVVCFLLVGGPAHATAKTGTNAPADAKVCFSSGVNKLNKGDNEGAIADLSKAIELDPKLAPAYAVRAYAKCEKEDLAGALSDATTALKFDPENFIAYATRGRTKGKKEDYDGAIPDLSKAIDLDPTDFSAYKNRGRCLREKGNHDGAIADYSKAIELNPKSAEAYFSRGSSKSAKQDYDGAITDYSKVIELNPKAGDAYLSRGICRKKKGDIDGTLSDFTTAIELGPKEPVARMAYYARGRVKSDQGDLPGALADLSAAIELYSAAVIPKPLKAGPYREHGYLRLRLKDIRGALADLSKAIEFDPKNSTAFEIRARAKVLNGEYEGARIDFRKSIDLSTGNNAYARFHLFLLNLRLKYPQSLPNFKATVHGWKDDWEKSVGLFLAGEIDEPAFLSLAANGDPARVREFLCEAFYYAGMLRLLKGDAAGAQTLFEKCLTTEVSNFVEFDFASAELSRLRAKH